MPAIARGDINEAPAVAFPKLDGVTPSAEVLAASVIGGADRPLWLWLYELAPGAQIRFELPRVGHVLYVLSGSVKADEAAIEAGGASVIEQGARSVIRAEGSGTRLLHFQQAESS